jgi:hypothetical protein
MTTPKRLRAIKDRRSTWARRHHQLAAAFATDLGSGNAADALFSSPAALDQQTRTSELLIEPIPSSGESGVVYGCLFIGTSSETCCRYVFARLVSLGLIGRGPV